MNPYLQACFATHRLSKSTLLAMLISQVDTTKVIVVASGEVISVDQVSQDDLDYNLNNKTWVFYENLMPRRMLLTNPNWTINSFNPANKQVCVQIFAKSGIRNLMFILPEV